MTGTMREGAVPGHDEEAGNVLVRLDAKLVADGLERQVLGDGAQAVSHVVVHGHILDSEALAGRGRRCARVRERSSGPVDNVGCEKVDRQLVRGARGGGEGRRRKSQPTASDSFAQCQLGRLNASTRSSVRDRGATYAESVGCAHFARQRYRARSRPVVLFDCAGVVDGSIWPLGAKDLRSRVARVGAGHRHGGVRRGTGGGARGARDADPYRFKDGHVRAAIVFASVALELGAHVAALADDRPEPLAADLFPFLPQPLVFRLKLEAGRPEGDHIARV